MVASDTSAVTRFICILALAFAASGSAQSSPLMRVATLNAIEKKIEQAPSPVPVPAGPFGLAMSANGTFAARWEKLQPMLRIEAKIVDMCRDHPDGCPTAAAKFLGIVAEARGLEGRARAGVINRAINLAIRPVSDRAQYGVQEFWASPLTTLASAGGDCEDYAVAKYAALRAAGVAAEDVRLVVARIEGGDYHAVVATRVDGRWLILDNRSLQMIADTDAAMTPLAAFGDQPEERPALVAVPSLDDFSV
jgi:predicted transglutaminase-like cysteine proteinase